MHHSLTCDSIGHLLVTARNHKVKVADLGAAESREIGGFLLHVLLLPAESRRYNENQGSFAPKVF